MVLLTKEELNLLIEHSQLFCKLECKIIKKYTKNLSIKITINSGGVYLTLFLNTYTYIFKGNRIGNLTPTYKFFSLGTTESELEILFSVKHALEKLKFGKEMFNIILKSKINKI